MGLQLPKHVGVPRKRFATGALMGALLFLLTGCGDAFEKDQWVNGAMPDPATVQAPYTLALWQWAWVAALATGAIVWGLIFYAIRRFRRRSDDEVPVQTRYNLPLEVFYTIAPILMVIAFFYQTVRVQDEMTHIAPDPDVTVEVVGQQWSWTFNHGVGEPNADADPVNGEYAYETYVHASGTAREIPTLVLPVDQTVQFNLWSPDVIHSFGVPAFLTKLDVVPGRVNQLQVTPSVEGTFAGKCFELCGVSHSRMLFNVEVVSQADYAAYLEELEAQGQVSDNGPLLGGADAYTQAGLAEDDSQEGSHE